MQQYFIGLGSNIEPEKNIIKILEALLKRYNKVHVSKILQTDPVGLKSSNGFLNAVVCISSSQSKMDLKKQLVQIEEHLGRDRSDPKRKFKDRTADLDILFSLNETASYISDSHIPKEKYVQMPLFSLLVLLGIETDHPLEATEEESVELWIKNMAIGKKAIVLHQESLNNH